MAIRAYARISVSRDESQSIGQQRHRIQRWAEYQHPGAEIHWYVDEGVSGSKRGVARPERDRLLQQLRRGDVLVALKVDRLARSVRDLLDIVNLAEERGASATFVEQGIDTSGAYGRFTLVLLAALAELEASIISERVSAAQQEFIRLGRHGAGKVPWGFVSVLDPEKGYRVVRPDPVKGPKLRQAILNIIAGSPQNAEARKLGLPEPTFRQMLDTTRLYGQHPGGGPVDPRAGVISMSEWQDLKRVRNGNRAWSRAPGFGAALECYECGARLYLNRNHEPKAGGTYGCIARHPKRPIIVRSKVDPVLEEWYLDHHGDAPLVETIWIGEDDTERRERVAAVEVEIDRALEEMREPGADVAKLAVRVTELHAERERVENEPRAGSWKPVLTGRTLRDRWAEAGDEERTVKLREAARFIIHPYGRAGGRIEVVPVELVAERYSEAVAKLRRGL